MALSDDAKRILMVAAQNDGRVQVWGDRYQSALYELKNADIIEPATKPKNPKIAEAKARLLGNKDKPTVVPMGQQLTPEEEDAIAKKGVAPTPVKDRQKGSAKASKAPKTGKGAPKPQNAADAKPEGKKGKGPKTPVPTKEKDAKTHGTGLPTSEQRPGIIETILRELCAATEKKPTTKQHIFDVLRKTFPERKESSMMSTINHQVPSYLRYAGHKIEKNEKGYWGVRDAGTKSEKRM